MTSLDDSVQAEHASRLVGLDPLLTAPPLAPGDDRVLLTAEADGGRALGLTQYAESAPDSDAALWGALRTHALGVRTAGPAAEAAIDALLDTWDRHLTDLVTVGDDETAAGVRWPSRDLVGPRSLVRHGFAPLATIAVRTAGRPGPSPRSTATVRAATAADLDLLAGYAVALLRADVPWGVLTERARQWENLRAGVSTSLTEGDLLLVAEDGGRVCGYLQATSVKRSTWMASLVDAAPMVYLPALYVDPAVRSAGVGAALADAAHRELDAAGVAATLLHYSAPSPVSVPFWSRLGYRPLWTFWQRRPAIR